MQLDVAGGVSSLRLIREKVLTGAFRHDDDSVGALQNPSTRLDESGLVVTKPSDGGTRHAHKCRVVEVRRTDR